jgi:uncharacterized protein DUF6894
MPIFHFNTCHGDECRDDPDGMELKDLPQAWHEATCTTGEILRDMDGALEREWRMDVSDHGGNALFSLRVIRETYVAAKQLKRG